MIYQTRKLCVIRPVQFPLNNILYYLIYGKNKCLPLISGSVYSPQSRYLSTPCILFRSQVTRNPAKTPVKSKFYTFQPIIVYSCKTYEMACKHPGRIKPFALLNFSHPRYISEHCRSLLLHLPFNPDKGYTTCNLFSDYRWFFTQYFSKFGDHLIRLLHFTRPDIY